MTPLEVLVMVLGIPFFIVEVYQLYELRKSQQKLTSIWERALADPDYAGQVVANAIFGFIEKLQHKDSAQAREMFLDFLTWSGGAVVERMKGSVGDNMIKMTKGGKIKPDKGLVDTANGLISQARSALLDGLNSGTAKQAVKKGEEIADSVFSPSS